MAYNYDDAIELFCKAYANEDTVTYQELQDALGLEYPIGEKEHLSLTSNAVGRFKEKLKKERGLTFYSACKGKASSPDLQYYNISEVKPGLVQKKEKSPELDIQKSFDALSRDNQKLYEEKQALLQRVDILNTELAVMRKKEMEYKKIITSFYSLSMC
jgi:hypothetical protein